MSPEDQVDDDRRRKREKLVRLHRFLGSRVPTNLILGIDDPTASLPPAAPEALSNASNSTITSEDRSAWLRRRRRSSSAAMFPSTWDDDLERLKEDLNEREKAINVRRAIKMEKVFGVAPPQTLYHTHAPRPSHQYSQSHSQSQHTSRANSRTQSPHTTLLDNSSSRSSPANTIGKNSNQGSLKNGSARRSPLNTNLSYGKTKRPGTSDSEKGLLPQKMGDAEDEGYGGFDEHRGRDGRERTNSMVYSHYQHSLNSLGDIIDRDDKESLAELHEYLTTSAAQAAASADNDLLTPTNTTPNGGLPRRSSIASLKSERRRSLPARTSMISLAESEISIASTISPPSSYTYSYLSPKPEVTDFQLRRRRAAKLTQFFGVDYRDLIRDVLDSIENGLEHERTRGTVSPEEAEVLLSKLRSIKTKRDAIY